MPSFRSIQAGDAIYNPGGLSSLGCVKPSGVAANDIMIASIILNADPTGAMPGWTSPTGWNQLFDVFISAGGTSYHWIVEWKRATASEPTGYTWTWSAGVAGSTYGDMWIAAYQGVNTTTAIDASGYGSQTATTTHTAPSETATYTNDLHVVLACEDNYGSWTPPSGYSERFDNSGYGSTLADKALTASGATGTVSFTSSASGGGLAAAILLIDTTPAGGGPSFQPAWASRNNQVNL